MLKTGILTVIRVNRNRYNTVKDSIKSLKNQLNNLLSFRVHWRAICSPSFSFGSVQSPAIAFLMSLSFQVKRFLPSEHTFSVSTASLRTYLYDQFSLSFLFFYTKYVQIVCILWQVFYNLNQSYSYFLNTYHISKFYLTEYIFYFCHETSFLLD